ncbi:MAG TPA: lipid A export permease/ATP-binding protein MsbA [Desulfosalsimonadaceae bacterium]|nr:lipid A export permease/ATP-binding protein MsbA [Desulfosalsimonadaceae bacterium]
MEKSRKELVKKRNRQLFAYIRDQWGKLSVAVLCMIVVAGTTSATAFIVKPVLDDVFLNRNEFMLKLMPLLIVVIYLLRGAGRYGQEFLMQYIGETIIFRLRNNLYDRISDLPLTFFHTQKTGGLMSRITYDVNIIKNMVSRAVTGALMEVFTILGLVVVIFYRDWKLALIAVFVLPAAFFPVVEFGRRVRRFSTRSQEYMSNLNAFLHETFSGNKIVKAFGMEQYEKQRFFDKNRYVFRFEVKSFRARALTSPVMEVMGGIGVALVIWYGGHGVIKGTSTPGTFFSFMTAVMMLYNPAKKLSKLNATVQRGLSAADRIFDILETRSDIQDPPDPVPLPRRQHRIDFENVSFAYESGEPVLEDVCLSVSPGEILAVVGASGGGKTTLVNLIPRFYEVSSGAVKIDGIDIRRISVANLRREIAVVTQEPILFNDTIANNIAYGSPEASVADIEKAAEAAYILSFINGLPKGMDTYIGELGSRLSGGEKQRICIARALLRDAPILILDEATAALDTESERLVQKALENLMVGRTSFIIAHRLSTIDYAHRIIVLARGQIVEQGTHAELMDHKGEYYTLYNMQFSENHRDFSAREAPRG